MTILAYLNISVKPKKGNAVMWNNCSQNGVTDVCFENAKHRGSPPDTGVKYALNIWIRFLPYRGSNGEKG